MHLLLLTRNLSTSPANFNAAIRFDGGFWRDNMAKLGPRFDAWLAQH